MNKTKPSYKTMLLKWQIKVGGRVTFNIPRNSYQS